VKRLRIGRLSIYIEPRDIWVGAYIARQAVYVCPVPLLVIKWQRHGAYLRRSTDSPVTHFLGQGTDDDDRKRLADAGKEDSDA
jgi:hypothetical protein